MRSILILGAGYAGEALIPLLLGRGYRVHATRRSHSAAAQPPEGLMSSRFDLDDPATWDRLPECWGCVWTFPAEPPGLVRDFSRVLGRKCSRLVVIGTTSSYIQVAEDQDIDESVPLDTSIPRVEGEEHLRETGAVILRAAGIYGPSTDRHTQRNPLEWLRRGLVAGPEKYLNVVHVHDLAVAILTALEAEITGEQFIVTDGHPLRWGAIEEWAGARRLLRQGVYGGSGRGRSRRLSNARLLAELRPALTHTDLFVEIESLERSASV